MVAHRPNGELGRVVAEARQAKLGGTAVGGAAGAGKGVGEVAEAPAAEGRGAVGEVHVVVRGWRWCGGGGRKSGGGSKEEEEERAATEVAHLRGRRVVWAEEERRGEEKLNCGNLAGFDC